MATTSSNAGFVWLPRKRVETTLYISRRDSYACPRMEVLAMPEHQNFLSRDRRGLRLLVASAATTATAETESGLAASRILSMRGFKPEQSNACVSSVGRGVSSGSQTPCWSRTQMMMRGKILRARRESYRAAGE